MSERHPPTVGERIADGVERGSMGLKGLANQLGNATSMLAITVFLFVLYRDWTTSLHAEQEFQRTQLTSKLDFLRSESQGSREALLATIRSLEARIEVFSAEMRTSRITVEKATAEIKAIPDKDKKPATNEESDPCD